MKIIQNKGDKSLWEREKTLFLCSKQTPLTCYEKVFQWVESFEKSGCVVCFNTSEFEEEVLKALLVCQVPTVCLLRMFYEDMGIHAIHKTINRPYSTIYNRIKSLTMNDEVLKGREFEDYVVDFFDLPHNKKLTLKDWRGDKTLPGIYPENNSAPDLVFSYDGHPFAIECKWRSYMPKDIEKEVLPSTRQCFFQQYTMPVYLFLGIGGLPTDPDKLYLAPVTESLSVTSLLQNEIGNSSDILQRIQLAESKQKNIPKTILDLWKAHPNAYKPWYREDDELLAKLRKEGKTVKDLSILFQRSPDGIRSRLHKLGML